MKKSRMPETKAFIDNLLGKPWYAKGIIMTDKQNMPRIEQLIKDFLISIVLGKERWESISQQPEF